MTTEWLVLWCHFLWSGSLTMYFAIACWHKIGLVSARAQSNPERNAPSEGAKSRQRLLRIAGMVSVCLLLNTIATVATSFKLEEWERTADIALTCEIKETWNSRSWNTYGFEEDLPQKACSQESATRVQGLCSSDCFWYPSITVAALTCQEQSMASLEEQSEAYQGVDAKNRQFNACDCDCSELVQISRPRFLFSSQLMLARRN
jgi:hypothetical protein